MEKIVLVDGNNLLFRSYYATAYNGNILKNSKGFPTNALYGFVNMINKIITEEKPKYIMVAFDKGKTFRHESYNNYKQGRAETPEELILQFPYAKQILDAMGIIHVEVDMYEADDIIGTYAKLIDENSHYNGTIISSDKDLLQLISSKIDVKLLKQKDYIRMDRDVFYKTYGIEPINMIDLKGLQGDSSDNIPGVKGIGEKTALKLLQQYTTVENIYANIDNITGSVKTKLLSDKDSAFMSKSLATIYKQVPIDTNLEHLKDEKDDYTDLENIYRDLEFYSFLKNIPKTNKAIDTDEVIIVNNIDDIVIFDDCAISVELDEDNYHNANIIGLGVYNEQTSIFIPYEILKQNPKFLTENVKYTYDFKRIYASFIKNNIQIANVVFDTMIASYLLNYNIKDDPAYLANQLDYNVPILDKKHKVSLEKIILKEIARIGIQKAKFIYETKNKFEKELIDLGMMELYKNIEFPLAKALAKMELEGIRVDKNFLNEMKQELKIKIELLSKDIYNSVGCEFNIASPKQLGEILYNKLQLPLGRKNERGYTTDAAVLEKLRYKHPVIEMILEYRTLTKLYSTYIEGILNAVSSDGKIHTIYNQTLTRTGRLSSIEPNLQNIPIRFEYGKLIRKAFISEEKSLIMSSDYSQIELRVFAHISGVKELIDAFNHDMDIHKKTAMDIFGVPENLVSSNMRRQAKAVNFGILYGISSYGLSEDLKISPKEAKDFIDKYLETYPGIKEYMNKIKEEAHKKGYVTTITNRRRIINELNNKNYMIRSMGERMALNTPIQGSSADILKKAMIEIDEKIIKQNLKSRMILQVHDELIFNVLESEKEIMKKLVASIMENAYKLSVPLNVDIEFGTNWYEAK